jgi:hypothetical protein
MGVRVYNPATGRFLQVDPIPGGSANPYDYCNQDPINCYDLMGTFWGSGLLKAAWHGIRGAAKFITNNKYIRTAFAICGLVPGSIGAVCGVLQAAAYAVQGKARDAAGALFGAAIGRLGDKAFEAIHGAGLLKTLKGGGVLSKSQMERIAKSIIQANSVALGTGTSIFISGRHDFF